METPLLSQLICALAALAGGWAFGLVYDLFRVIRPKKGKPLAVALCDLLVCLWGFAILFCLSMTLGEGELRLYIVLTALLGGAVYFLVLSPPVLVLFRYLAAQITKPLRRAKKFFLLSSKKLKKLFKNLRKRYTIIMSKKKAKSRKARRAKERGTGRGRTEHEVEEIEPDIAGGGDSCGSVFGHYPAVTEIPDGGSDRQA